MKHSYLFDTDSYKTSHYLQYPPGTTSMFSYVEAREGSEYPEVVFFGLQYFLKEYLTHRVTVEEVEAAKGLYALHGVPFNYDGWMYIAKELKGKLPVRIRAPKEGSVIPINNVLLTIESTDPKVFWVVSWLETLLLRIWYPITVATRSYTIKKIIKKALEQSSDNPDAEINFKLHDFGSRGVSSQESAMLGDMAHLVNFMGTDTVVGLLGAREYYNCKMAGFSIPAAEHSSITSFGKDKEVDAYRNMLKQFAKPGAILAVVSDSYDLWNACSKLWGEELKQEIIDSGATVVIRPDSGHPATVVLKTVEILAEKFGTTTNSKGFKVLNYVRVIQGDGVNEHSIQEILDNLLSHGYSASNIAFGMGGALLQMVNRDTNRFALKCSSIMIDGQNRDVYKMPATDDSKKSKAGRLDLVKWAHGNYQTVTLKDNFAANEFSCLSTVYKNGDILVEYNLDEIRKEIIQHLGVL